VTISSPPEPPKDTPTTTYTSVPILSTIGTDAWFGTQLAADNFAPTTKGPAPAPTASDSPPVDIPEAIDAPEAERPQPEGTTKIRIGFNAALHWDYVIKNYTSSAQIFRVTPQLLAWSQNIDRSLITPLSLGYLDTIGSLGYRTTVVFLYFPTSAVPTLQIDMQLPSSRLYHSEITIEKQLGNAINPTIKLIPGDDEVASSGSGSESGGDPFNTQETANDERTPGEKGATAGIAMGAIFVSAAYGAAMFIVARRYKRKKQAHRRASSISNSSDMRYSGNGAPPMMGGALLSPDLASSAYGGVASAAPGGRESHGSGRSGMNNSGRTAFISAPVAAENSLGWNWCTLAESFTIYYGTSISALIPWRRFLNINSLCFRIFCDPSACHLLVWNYWDFHFLFVFFFLGTAGPANSYINTYALLFMLIRFVNGTISRFAWSRLDVAKPLFFNTLLPHEITWLFFLGSQFKLMGYFVIMPVCCSDFGKLGLNAWGKSEGDIEYE
jgi:hypothetical protein